jgi:hypothetical protein
MEKSRRRENSHIKADRRLLLLILLAFNAATAFGGGAALLAHSDEIRPELLQHTPFDTYFVPALLLILVVGGTALAALISHLQRERQATALAFWSGVILLGWIICEAALVRHFSWLQILYVLSGLAVIRLTEIRTLRLKKR